MGCRSGKSWVDEAKSGMNQGLLVKSYARLHRMAIKAPVTNPYHKKSHCCSHAGWSNQNILIKLESARCVKLKRKA